MANPLHNMKTPHSSATRKKLTSLVSLQWVTKKSAIYMYNVGLLSYKPQVNESSLSWLLINTLAH